MTIGEIRTAATRIAGYVRRTPLISCHPVRDSAEIGESLMLKLECLQVTGSFKARGAINKLKSLSPDNLSRGIITASGGNHGLAVAYAGSLAKVPTRIYLPTTAPPEKIEKLKKWGAEVVIEGTAWDDSNRAALSVAEREGLAYFHPFADPAVIAGQGTVAELRRSARTVLTASIIGLSQIAVPALPIASLQLNGRKGGTIKPSRLDHHPSDWPEELLTQCLP
jgi:threonine dehydratase